MTTFTIKTANGFNTDNAFAFSNPKTTLKSPIAWIEKDSVTNEKHIWYGTGFTYDANNHITGGTATKLVVYDAANAVQATVQFSTPWDFATQAAPSSYAALLAGDDSIVGGAGDDVLGSNNGIGTNANGVYTYNGHSYLLSNAGTWTTAQAEAQSLGGNLVTVNDQAEQNWLVTTFLKNDYLWIGYTDQETEGLFKWISGENSTYTNWASPMQPDNAFTAYNGGIGEDYVHLWSGAEAWGYVSGQWNDLRNDSNGVIHGIIEINNINSGNDTLKGGQGNDTYFVDSAGDKVIENAGQGMDTVNSSITYKLVANVENLTLTGTEKINGLGNDLANVITGNSAANVLAGYDGNDSLSGGAGDDQLSGGTGNDSLQGGDGFDTAIYSGNFSGYHLEYLNNALQITDTDSANGNYGVDTLTGVEAVQFSDKTLYTNAADIFKTQLIGAEKQVAGGENVGMIRTMADFSKAAYFTTHGSFVENNVINDISPNADIALAAVQNQGWSPLNLSPVFPSVTSQIAGQTVINGMFSDGFYVNGNAAACVERCGDAVVISFRGTNDNGDTDNLGNIVNPNDSTNTVHPDKSDWTSMPSHYALLQPLVDAFNSYVLANHISQVYVTGHSLGGAMAIKFMADHANGSFGANYESVTFAAPGYSTDKYTDPRLTHIEISGDPVPDLGLHGSRTINFEGNQTPTSVSTEYHATYHSMDYYRQITDSVDASSWTKILAETGDQTVLLGGRVNGNDFVVDGQLSGNNSNFDAGNDTLKDNSLIWDYNVFYGGKGNDNITGGGAAEMLLGGVGRDVLNGKGGADRLYGGAGNDVLTGGGGTDAFVFDTALNATTNLDTITDFNVADDTLWFDHSIFTSISTLGALAADMFTTGTTALDSNDYFVYNNSNGGLFYDDDGNGTDAAVEVALLGATNHPSLSASDFLIV